MNAKALVTTPIILFPTDFSPVSEAGLPEATALARQMGAKLLILHVQQPLVTTASGEVHYASAEANEETLREMLDAVKPDDPAVACERRLVVGDPAEEIVRVAAKEKARLIAMGTHGRTGLGRLLMGSVAEAVLRRAPCPVMTFRNSLQPVGAER